MKKLAMIISSKKFIISISAVVVAALVLFGTLYLTVWKSDALKDAFDPKNYDTVQIVTTFKSEDSSQNDELTEGSGDVSDEYDDYSVDSDAGYYNDGNYNIDSDGNLVSDDGTSNNGDTSQQEEAEPETLSTMQKDGDIIYETGVSGDYYYYSSEGSNYVLWKDTMYGIREEGVWTQVPADRFSMKASFDVNCLSLLSPKDFQKQDGLYVPKNDNMMKVFQTLFGISETNIDKYFVFNLQVSIEKGRLKKVSVNYIYDNDYNIAQTMTFSYDNIKLTLPEVEEVYKDDAN